MNKGVKAGLCIYSPRPPKAYQMAAATGLRVEHRGLRGPAVLGEEQYLGIGGGRVPTLPE